MANKQAVAFVYGGVAAVLLLCLFDMPYGFYTFVRFAATAAFCYFAFKAHEAGNAGRMILFIALAVLFQPFIKIPLGRVIWNIADVIIAVYLIVLLVRLIKQ